MLLPAAAAVCALAASRCYPLETSLKATKATTTMLLPAAAAGAAARGGEPHTETPLKATKATKTMLLLSSVKRIDCPLLADFAPMAYSPSLRLLPLNPAEEVPVLALVCEADPAILASARLLLLPRQRMYTTVKKSTVPIFVFDRLEQLKTMTRVLWRMTRDYQGGRAHVINSLLEVKVVTKTAKGLSLISATYNNAEAVQNISKLLWHIGYTGIGSE
ncbi:hypothetical protein T492DRAFT_854027, partial [Pavlovales sp. CCMP2436]